jgi:hypothetical protein
MTQDQPDLASTFACVAQVGTYGDGNERPIAAMHAAVSHPANDGGCNDGFLRDDAILVVTLLTDAPPKTATEQVAGDVVQWRDQLVAAKNGDETAITLLGLVSDGDVPNGLCSGNIDDSGEGAPKMREFVSQFSHHVLASICQADYAPFFAQAVQIVDTTCDEFVPEG